MSETFKINMYFDEKGEKLEELIKHLIKIKFKLFLSSIEGRKDA